MNTSGDAAEQVVRLSIEGVEMAAKLVGSGAKELATFLYAVLRADGQQQQNSPMLKGRERLSAMLKSGKELKVFALKEADLKAFCNEAKRFGVGYYVVRRKGKSLDGLCDIMVPAEQASMVARIVGHFGYQPTDRATLQAQVEQERAAGFTPGPPTNPKASPMSPSQNGPREPGSAPRLSSIAPTGTAAASKRPSVQKRLEEITAALKRKTPQRAPQQHQQKRRKQKKKGAKIV